MLKYYNDPLIKDFLNQLKKESLNEESTLHLTCESIKKRIIDLINGSTSLLNNYRFLTHFKNDLSNVTNKIKPKNEKEVMLIEANYLKSIINELSSFLEVEIDYTKLCLMNLSESRFYGKITKENLIWSANKIDLIELIYALFYSKCINNGEVKIKEIVEKFEHFFSINLGAYYRVFVDITRRKTERTRFTTKLSTLIDDKLDEIDNK